MKKLTSTGTIEWTQTFGNYRGGVNKFAGLEAGKDVLIYNECWGVAPRYEGSSSTTQVGYTLACGTGIEGCSAEMNLDSSTTSECNSDPRRDWRALTVATDLKGERVYSRMDSFMGNEGGEVYSSAAEYVFASSNGKTTVITDEAYGLAILTLEATTTCDSSSPNNDKDSDNKPDDTKPDDTKPDDTKPDDTKPDDTKPDDTKPDTDPDTKPDPEDEDSTDPVKPVEPEPVESEVDEEDEEDLEARTSDELWEVEVGSLMDVFNEARDFGEFMTLFFVNPWVMFVWFTLW